MPYAINMDYPGYNQETAISDVCDLIGKEGFVDVLEYGAFAGRLTHSMCNAFPGSQFTAIERFGDGIVLSDVVSGARIPSKAPTFGPQYADLVITEEWFRTAHPFHNLDLINDDYFIYSPQYTRLFPKPGHDLVIVNQGPEPLYAFEHVYDTALRISGGMVIGFVSNHYPTYLDSMFNLYDCDLLTNGIIRVKTKI